MPVTFSHVYSLWITLAIPVSSWFEMDNMSSTHCCKNRPILSPGYGQGHVEEIGGLNTYVVGSVNSRRGILLVTDIYGYEAVNLRKLADKVAAAGYYVVAPDFFYGDYFNPDNPERPYEIWMKDHGTDKGLEDAKPVIAALKSKGISAIGAAGFCWGGKVVSQLAETDDIQAAVLLHPALVTVDDIKGVKDPIAILGGELDDTSPPSLLKQFEEILCTKPEVDSYVKIFPGVEHGWTLRYDDKDETAVKMAKEAHANMLDWFSKYVK